MTHLLTVTDLLDRTGLKLEPVVVHRTDAAVRWVATSELEDPTPYLEGGEVELTTGLAMTGHQPGGVRRPAGGRGRGRARLSRPA